MNVNQLLAKLHAGLPAENTGIVASGLSSLDFRVDYGVFSQLAALLKSSFS